jgi:hypothetical protein
LSWFLSSFLKLGGGGMVFNATFNNISAINIVAVSLLVEETVVPGENHRPVASQLHHLMLYWVHLALHDSNSQR